MRAKYDPPKGALAWVSYHVGIVLGWAVVVLVLTLPMWAIAAASGALR
jgi:hypothetical protein